MTNLEQELLWALYDMVGQHCTGNESSDSAPVFSDFLSANARAMRLLGHYGMIRITNEGTTGRCVEGRMLSLEEAARGLQSWRRPKA